MPALIEASCINCDMCVPECPNDAISMGAGHYEVDAARCTECIGYYATPTCIAVCPIDCIVIINEP